MLAKHYNEFLVAITKETVRKDSDTSTVTANAEQRQKLASIFEKFENPISSWKIRLHTKN